MSALLVAVLGCQGLHKLQGYLSQVISALIFTGDRQRSLAALIKSQRLQLNENVTKLLDLIDTEYTRYAHCVLILQ